MLAAFYITCNIQAHLYLYLSFFSPFFSSVFSPQHFFPRVSLNAFGVFFSFTIALDCDIE